MMLALLVALAGSAGAGEPAPTRACEERSGRLLPRPVERQMAALDRVAVGTWIEHRIGPVDGAGQTYQLRLAVVGREPAAPGRPAATWLELIASGSETPQHAFKVLVVSNPDRTLSFLRMIIQFPTGAPRELPPERLPRDQGSSAGACTDAKVRDLGQQTVTTPAGRFRTQHRRILEPDNPPLDLWTSARVPMTGLVKLVDGNTQWLLTGHGADAASLVTGEPERFALPVELPAQMIEALSRESQDPAKGGTDPLELPP